MSALPHQWIVGIPWYTETTGPLDDPGQTHSELPSMISIPESRSVRPSVPKDMWHLCLFDVGQRFIKSGLRKYINILKSIPQLYNLLIVI